MSDIHITPELLAQMLHFPDGVKITGARWFTEWGRSAVVLELHGSYDTPDGPIDLASFPRVDAVYEWSEDCGTRLLRFEPVDWER